MKSRDEMRAAWAASGLRFSDLKKTDLESLRTEIDAAMEKSGVIHGTLRTSKIHGGGCGGGQRFAAIRCKADYFDDREAVTFNSDGFVGFAGWADDKNVQPILDGFSSWLEGFSAWAAIPSQCAQRGGGA